MFNSCLAIQNCLRIQLELFLTYNYTYVFP